MSLTATKTQTNKRQSRDVLPSPPKRRRLSEDNKETEGPTTRELWEWTLKSTSVAKCYARDTMNMRKETQEGCDFYWLGRAPCRRVEIYGIVVGIQIFEKKINYTVDDGTAVIDCVHLPQLPSRPQPNNKYVRPSEPEILPSPIPVTSIGGIVRVIGRVKQKYETKNIIVDEISNSILSDQLGHWKTVRELHRTHYSRPGPFIIPISNNNPGTPRRKWLDTIDPHTPSVIASSPGIIAEAESQSPPKLRHPSRLRSHNLTDTAFRLYVKHFIDNADGQMTPQDDTDELSTCLLQHRPNSDNLRTPTKSRRYAHDHDTPRPGADLTPCLGDSNSASAKQCSGFTLSYLRRVPELSLMASRVVKQRAREEDKKVREFSSQSAPKDVIKHPKLDKVGLARRKKRLFQWAICELLREGNIVLWDGPKWPCTEEGTYGGCSTSALWNYTSSTTSDHSLFSNASNTYQTSNDDDLTLSDPEPDEECYVSTTPGFLSSAVEDALKGLAAAPPPKKVVKRNELIGGYTQEDILGYLRRDDRWAFIGEWNINEALAYMEKEGSVWRLGENKWLLTQ